MNGDLRTDRPHVTHRLGVALRFLDMFTARPIDVPLDVRAEALPPPPPPPPPPLLPDRRPGPPWRAFRRSEDATYRFLVTDPVALPNGVIPVTVEAPGAEYVNFEPLNVVLPRPFVAHPPTPDRSDFLIERVLWPTRRATLTPGETVIIGRLRSMAAIPNPVARLRVRMSAALVVPPTPYTYTNDAGEFVFRFPALKRLVTGTTVTTTANLRIEIHTPPAYAVSVVPLAPVFPFLINLGQTTVMEIQIP
jgi:hypothetical protein